MVHSPPAPQASSGALTPLFRWHPIPAMPPDSRDTTDPLTRSNRDWEIFAQEDPLWAILSHPDKQGRRWSLDEFLATGEGDVTRLIRTLESLATPVARHDALDFGCGVGRIAIPLTRRFERVTGLDAAPSMIAQAQRLNPAPDRLTFVHSDTPRLPFADASFDVVHTYLVLQHIPVDATFGYLREFVRILRPRGVAYFVIPARFGQATGRRSNETTFSFATRAAHMEMHCIPISEVAALAESLPVDIERISTEQQGDVLQATYVLRRT